MLLDQTHLRHWIDHFYGYGSWQARIWFVALEDGGGDLPEEVAEKVEYFYKAHGSPSQATLCDIRELYRKSSFHYGGTVAGKFSNLFEYRFDRNAVQNNVWKNLIGFVQGYSNKNIPDVLAYQKNHLASPTSQEALIKLYPLPSPHNHAWYYSWLDMPQLSFLKSRELYLEHLYEIRIRTLLENIDSHKPEVVVMYGMNNINALKKSVLTHFPSAIFKTFKAIPRVIPQHHRTTLPGTTLIITTQIPTLRHGRVETGFDWRKFGEMVRP